ncbi:tetratricopeptide repeat protein [Streptomyces fragilis]|uniref:Tetratricopeptide repeat protein n=1 Tax=Streptomyces fragilis TaxID=67301 RepID=A0ABV2YJC3_9ACTN|nr:tetratricopeptide repeat protein [Streptomyces fragilis]
MIGTFPDFAPSLVTRDVAWEETDRCVVVTGPAGVGKTQFAASLAAGLWDDGLDLLVWANASVSAVQIVETYAEVALELAIPGAPLHDPRAAAEVFLRWLAVTGRRWLVVLDGVDDVAEIARWLPQGKGPGIRVVVTTRGDGPPGPYEGLRSLRLEPFSPADAVAYVHERLTEEERGDLYDEREAAVLAERLHGFPAALALAVAYVAQQGCAIPAYLERLRGVDTAHLAACEAGERAVAAAVLLALRAVEEADRTRFALPLVRLMAHFDPQGHPLYLLSTGAVRAHLCALLGRGGRSLLRVSRSREARLVVRALNLLRAYGLVAVDPDEGQVARAVRTCGPVNAVVRADVPREEAEGLVRLAADALHQWAVELELPDSDVCFRPVLRANARVLVELGGPLLLSPDPHPVLAVTGESLLADCLHEEAVAHGEEHLRLLTAALGRRHPATLDARADLAAAYGCDGREREALDVLIELLPDREAVHGADAPETTETRARLGHAYFGVERGAEAVRHLRDAVDRLTVLFGADDERTWAAHHSLAVAHAYIGRPREAIRLCSELLAGRLSAGDADDPAVLALRHDLVLLHVEAGLAGQGVRLGELTVAECTRVLGPDDPGTLSALTVAAVAHRVAGNVRQALRHAERGAQGLERCLGADRRLSLDALSELAHALHAGGQERRALEMREHLLGRREHLEGPGHLRILGACHELALSYAAAGRREEALRLLERAVAGRTDAVGPDDPETLRYRHEVAAVHRAWGRTDGARLLATRLLADQERALEPGHPDTGRTRKLLEGLGSGA